MAVESRTGRRSAALARVALALAASLASGAPAVAAWPRAEPGQPLVQAERVCASGVVPIDRRCKVVDFTELGETAGRRWFYAFYATHWADRHGSHDRGFPVVFYLERPATLRLSLWINDEPGLAGPWAKTAPARPVLNVQPDAVYLGFAYKVARGPDAERLFRLKGRHWSEITVLHRSDADEAMIEAATPRGCATVDEGAFDWTAFRLRIPLRDRTGASCGALTAELGVREQTLYLTSVSRAP